MQFSIIHKIVTFLLMLTFIFWVDVNILLILLYTHIVDGIISVIYDYVHDVTQKIFYIIATQMLFMLSLLQYL
uniref:Succinate dehydrogenase subunit 4 n=1 Tax=Cyanoptyche gloeocystis TaxID=77922 RepID=A0A096Y6W2_9EUKA|nr:succinate dehydrogenase subunit 4 [Cyanoptyche gloeocystis]AIM52068.1 succinate dehydrogenase subunit 4 [Cyanoptyche gloeocystis]